MVAELSVGRGLRGALSAATHLMHIDTVLYRYHDKIALRCKKRANGSTRQQRAAIRAR